MSVSTSDDYIDAETCTTTAAKTGEIDVHTVHDCGTPSDDHSLCRVATQDLILAYSLSAVLASSGGAELMTIETH